MADDQNDQNTASSTPTPSKEATLKGTIEAKIQLPDLGTVLTSLAGLVEIKEARPGYKLAANELAVVTFHSKHVTIHYGPGDTIDTNNSLGSKTGYVIRLK